MSDQPLVQGLDFIGVASRDVEKTLAFYRDTLGLKPDEHAKYDIWAGNTCLSIWEPEVMGMPFEASNNGPALHVKDVATSRSRLEAEGVVFQGDTIDTGVCHMAIFNDPDGNQVILHNRYKPRDE